MGKDGRKKGRKNSRKRRARIRKRGLMVLLLLVLAVYGAGSLLFSDSERIIDLSSREALEDVNPDFRERLKAYAEREGREVSEWPEELVEAAEKNPETEEFVMHYPEKKDSRPPIDLNRYRNSEEVPLLLQWDERWGYTEYAGEVMGISGCGPTCLSMVSIYLTGNPKYSPRFLAEFSKERGYYVNGKGSTWTLMTEGAEALGLTAYPIALSENNIRTQLENDHPVICAMSPGHFTTTGHFIVLSEYQNGKIRVRDPFSRKRSEQLWSYEDISDEISGIWAYSSF